MTTLNLTPVLDALGGTTTTTATFKAEARRAGRRATRVSGDQVAFATELVAVWDGTGWDVPPQLYPLPVDCYWNVKVQAAGNRLERNVVVPDGNPEVAFGDLIAVVPDTGTVDVSTVAQYQATQRFVSNQVTQIGATAATIFDTVATVQAQIDTAAAQSRAAALALAAVQVAQAEIDDDLATVVTAATQTAADRAATAADRAAADAAAASITSQVNTAVAALVAGAPGALDTLNELAAALGDDANFATTVANALATKAPLASPAFTGTVTGITAAMVGLGNVANLAPANLPVSSAVTAALAAQAATNAATYQTLGQGLLAWTYAQAFQLVSATRDANEAITTAAIVWPDGATGTFTTDTASAAFPGAIDAYHVTHVLNGTTKTVTQPAVTRDAGGAVTAQPALTVA